MWKRRKDKLDRQAAEDDRPGVFLWHATPQFGRTIEKKYRVRGKSMNDCDVRGGVPPPQPLVSVCWRIIMCGKRVVHSMLQSQ